MLPGLLRLSDCDSALMRAFARYGAVTVAFMADGLWAGGWVHAPLERKRFRLVLLIAQAIRSDGRLRMFRAAVAGARR